MNGPAIGINIITGTVVLGVGICTGGASGLIRPGSITNVVGGASAGAGETARSTGPTVGTQRSSSSSTQRGEERFTGIPHSRLRFIEKMGSSIPKRARRNGNPIQFWTRVHVFRGAKSRGNPNVPIQRRASSLGRMMYWSLRVIKNQHHGGDINEWQSRNPLLVHRNAVNNSRNGNIFRLRRIDKLRKLILDV